MNNSEERHSDQDSASSHTTKKKRTCSGRPVAMAQGGSHQGSYDQEATMPVEMYIKDISILSSRMNIIGSHTKVVMTKKQQCQWR